MTYPEINRYFTLACFTLLPILGSGVTAIWHGAALWCLFAIMTKREFLSGDRDIKLLTAYICLYALAVFTAFLFHGGGGLRQWGQLLHLLTLLLIPFAYALFSISDKARIMQAAGYAAATASFGAVALALIQYFLLEIRAEGGDGNALVFATVASLCGLVALSSAFMANARFPVLMLCGYGAALMAVLLSGSRSVWISMAVASILIVIFCRRQAWLIARKHHYLLVGAGLIVAIVSSGIVMQRLDNVSADLNQMVSETDYNSSLGLRTKMLEIGLEIVSENPVLGIGIQNIRPQIKEHLSEAIGHDVNFSHFHNGFLNILIGSGPVALFAISAIFVLLARVCVRVLKNSKRTNEELFGALLLLSLLTTYGISGFFNILLGQDIIDTLFAFILVVGLYLATGTSKLESNA